MWHRFLLVDDHEDVRATHAVGMAATESLDVVFDGIPLPASAAVGRPGFYLERPGFWHGAVGVTACWFGGALGACRICATGSMNRPLTVSADDLGTSEAAWLACPQLAACPAFDGTVPRHAVVLAPHPDDEVLAAGGTMRLLAQAGASLHRHVHGANLGVRADAYVAVGGFAPLRSGEDHAMWRALHASSRPCVATRTIEVLTSARRRGRAPGGFSKFLRNLEHH